jgi:hypothetical protein
MKILLITIIVNIAFWTNAIATTVNCDNGKCDFINSIHYKSATTYCLQLLNYEEVKTDYLFFTILETGEQCRVIDSDS